MFICDVQDCVDLLNEQEKEELLLYVQQRQENKEGEKATRQQATSGERHLPHFFIIFNLHLLLQYALSLHMLIIL